MPIKQLPHEKAGWGATLIALLVLAAAMAIVGVVVWLRMAPQGTPTQPNQAGKAHSELRIPASGVAGRKCRGASSAVVSSDTA